MNKREAVRTKREEDTTDNQRERQRQQKQEGDHAK